MAKVFLVKAILFGIGVDCGVLEKSGTGVSFGTERMGGRAAKMPALS